MEFSNLYFLYILLPLTLVVYFFMPDIRKKNTVLLVVSLLFYAMGQPLYVLLMVGLSYLNYLFALRMDPQDRGTILLPVAVNILVLAVFKYLDFFLGMIGLGVEGGLLLSGLKGMVKGLNSIGFAFREPTTVLPIGISFYIFSVISYLVDVYREKVPAEKNFPDLLLYLTMFPKLLQGPIVRYEQIAPQLTQRSANPRMIFEGAQRFAFGLAKKVLLADYAGKVVSELSATSADSGLVSAWLSAIMFMFQIYYDFSGYTDMAIGLGRIFGFKYCENFDLPYTSKSITEFWRRWHMSLGSFFRDYVYIPLGGNRKGNARRVVNMLAVWALTGLWHGANWNYVIWGLYFFILLTVEKQIMPMLETLHDGVRRAITLILVLFGWVIFSHEDLGSLGTALGAMIGLNGFAGAGVWTKFLNALPLLIACAIGSSPLPRMTGQIFAGMCAMSRRRKNGNRITGPRVAYLAVTFAVICLLLWLSTVSLVGSTSAPSIYANF